MRNNQGHIGDYYKIKKNYYENRYIPFLEVNLPFEKDEFIIKSEETLNRVINFYQEVADKEKEFKKWFPHNDIKKL